LSNVGGEGGSQKGEGVNEKDPLEGGSDDWGEKTGGGQL